MSTVDRNAWSGNPPKSWIRTERTIRNVRSRAIDRQGNRKVEEGAAPSNAEPKNEPSEKKRRR